MLCRILLTGDFIFSSSFDKTARAWLFDVSELGEGNEERACIKTFKVYDLEKKTNLILFSMVLPRCQGHQKGVYPLIFIPSADELDDTEGEGPSIRPGDILLTGSADNTARSWSFESAGCLKQFRGHTGAVTTMATDSSGKVLFTAGADSTIKSWNIQSAQLLKVSHQSSSSRSTPEDSFGILSNNKPRPPFRRCDTLLSSCAVCRHSRATPE